MYTINVTTANIVPLILAPTSINAIGYNVLDNFIYGYAAAYNRVIRFTGSGSFANVSAVNTGTISPSSGDVDPNGQYYFSSTVVASLLTTWYQMNLNPSIPATFGTIVNSGTSLAGAIAIDWVYVPGGGDNLYSVSRFAITTLVPGVTLLQSWSTVTKQWTTIANLGFIVGNNNWGAMYAGAGQTFYASENTSGDIYQFSIRGGAPTFISRGPALSSNDGARCARAV